MIERMTIKEILDLLIWLNIWGFAAILGLLIFFIVYVIKINGHNKILTAALSRFTRAKE